MKPRLIILRYRETSEFRWHCMGIGDLGSLRAVNVERAVRVCLLLWRKRADALA
jgi:hypothetical protein